MQNHIAYTTLQDVMTDLAAFGIHAANFERLYWDNRGWFLKTMFNRAVLGELYKAIPDINERIEVDEFGKLTIRFVSGESPVFIVLD